MRTRAVILLTAAVLLGARALPASAQEVHTLEDRCAIVPYGEPNDMGNNESYWQCFFDTPDGDQTVQVMFHRNEVTKRGGHIAAILTPSWNNIYYSGQLEAFNPTINIDLYCAAEFGDWDNVVAVPAGEVALAPYFRPGRASWSDNYFCPDDLPYLMMALVDTSATW